MQASDHRIPCMALDLASASGIVSPTLAQAIPVQLFFHAFSACSAGLGGAHPALAHTKTDRWPAPPLLATVPYSILTVSAHQDYRHRHQHQECRPCDIGLMDILV